MMTHTIVDGGLVAVINGKEYTVARDNPVYTQVRGAILNRDDESTIAKLFELAESVKRYTGDKIEIKDDTLYYRGAPLRNLVVDKIFEFMSKGLPHEPLIRFLDRVMLNPSVHSQEELYKFLEANQLVITEDGYFLGYKGIRENYTDQFSGKYNNSPGKIISMPREEVDEDRRKECSYGFHVGSLQYATGFGPKCVIVQVDPADVVSVPLGNHTWKIRTCKYKVLCDYQGPLPLPLYDTDEEDVYDVEIGW